MEVYYTGLIFVCGLFGSICLFNTEYVWKKVLKKQRQLGNQRVIIFIIGIFLIISAVINLFKLLNIIK